MQLTREALIRFLVHLKHAFPDWIYRLEQVMVFPDLSGMMAGTLEFDHLAVIDFSSLTSHLYQTVVVRGVQEGTQKGSYMVSSPTDRPVSLPFLAVHRFRDAVMTNRWYTLDHLSLLSQLRVHRVYPLDYEFFVPAELSLRRMKMTDAAQVEICPPFSQVSICLMLMLLIE